MRKSLYIFAFLLLSAKLFAQQESFLNELKGNQVAVDSFFTVSDEKFNNSTSWGLISQHISVDNIISFEINYDTSIYFYNTPFLCTMHFKIYQYGDESDTSHITDSTTFSDVNLNVNYDTTTGKAYKGVALFRFAGSHKYKVKILSIASAQLSPIPAIFRLTGQIVIERKYTFNDNSSDVTRYSVVNGNQLQLSWTPSNYPGAEMFDLEYTHIDGNSQPAVSIQSYVSGTDYNVPADSLAKWFKNNSTRITTAASQYLLDVPYDSGFILFRIRGVQIHYSDNLRWEGNWNYYARKDSSSPCTTPSCPSGAVLFDGHEKDLNWQYSVSFAEEGKRKEVISYFDGTLRNRQSVTLNNSDNKNIVQETIYDALGRSAASILPAPTKDSTIHYFRGFNNNRFGDPYSFTDLAYSGCSTTADSITQTSGAGRYYSPNNQFLANYYAKYIPYAGGYPLAVTEYIADNTGRIKSQGGVGPTFQLGSGRETNYFYGKPTQTELDRLFGAEAGDASHFLKNMVVDPNGQISVSYVDANGKTVATALAGATPPNVHSLPSNNGSTSVRVSNQLLQPSDFTRNALDHSLTASSTFLAPVTGDYYFKYRVDPLRYDKLFGPNKDSVICSSCYYDLEVLVKNACDSILLRDTMSAGTVFDTACTNHNPIVDSSHVTIGKIGEYYVTFNLRVSGDALNFYDSLHLVKNSDLKKLDFFLLDELKNTDFYGCYSECSTCFDKLGTKPDFLNTFRAMYFADSLAFGVADSLFTVSLYDSLYANCQSLQAGCNQGNVCDERLILLKADVTPGGQYALYDSTYHLLETPINVLAKRSAIAWFPDESGMRDSVILRNVAGDDSIKVDVKSLNDSMFIRYWKDSWADSLVRLHPEYCYYLWCLANSDSYEFDNEIQQWLDADTAKAKGWFYPPVYDTIMAHDPFFLSGGKGYPLRTRMSDSLRLFSRTLVRLSQSDKNILQFGDIVLYCKTQYNGWDACNPDSACRSRNREWFLYKELYLNLKQRFYEEARRTSSDPTFSSCTNCKIGADLIGTLQNDSTYIPFTDSTCNYSCPGGVYNPYDRDSISLFVEYGNPHTAPTSVPGGYAGCKFYPVFDLKTGAHSSCKFFNVWVCIYDSTCPGGGVCHSGTVYPSQCTPTGDDTLYRNKIRRYPDYVNPDDYINNLLGESPQGASEEAQQQIQDQCHSNCEAQADYWINVLHRCSTDTTKMNSLKASFIDICSKACSINNPQGASSIPSSVTATYHSFEEAIIGILGPGSVNDSCTQELLSNPYPYNKLPVEVNPTIMETNYDICHKLTQQKSAYLASGFAGSFHAYLKYNYGDAYGLDSLELDDMIHSCTSCNGILQDDIVLPPLFNPNSTPCVGCDTLHAVLTAFNTKFPTLDSANDDYEDIFTNFFNHRLGFALTYVQYKTFLDSCSAHSGGGGIPDTSSTRYFRAITIDHTKVANTDQTGFPVLISGTYSYLKTIANGGKVNNSNGYDIEFTTDSLGAIKLDWEIEKYDASTGQLIAWVKTDLSTTTDKVIYLQYGDARITAFQGNVAGTWSSGYQAVYHLKDGTTLDATDATSNGNDGTISGATAVSGEIGGAADFVKSSTQYIAKAAAAVTSYPLTISAWFKPADISSNGVIAGLSLTGSGPGRKLLYANSGTLKLYAQDGALNFSFPGATTSYAAHTWYYGVAVFESATSFAIYQDGGNIGTDGTTVTFGSPDNTFIGRDNDAGNYFNGDVDEVRISHVAKSADCILTEYYNQSSPSTFYGVGSEHAIVSRPSAANHFRTITIDHTKVANTNQAGFPVLISGTYSYLKTIANGGEVNNSNGYDITFTEDSIGMNKLSWEVERYNASTGELVAWVNTNISSSTDKTIYIHYGDAGITTFQGNVAGTWNTGYQAVYHLKDGTTLSAADATSNAINGSITGATAATGKVDGAAALSGSSQYIDLGNNLGITGDMTISAWVNPANFTSESGILSKTAWNQPKPYDYKLWNSSGLPTIFRGDGTGSNDHKDANTAPSLNTWSYIVVTIKGDTVSHYLNASGNGGGVLNAGGNPANGSNHAYIATREDMGPMFAGTLDEVRISNVARSADWVSTEYNNQSSPSTFYSIGTERNVGGNDSSSFPLLLCNQPATTDIPVDQNSCTKELFATALTNAAHTYLVYIDSVKKDFESAWLTKCMNVQPVLNMTADLYEYHYTLYYYDQSGGLVKTIPPEGVSLLDSMQIDTVRYQRLLRNEGCYQYSDSILMNNNGQVAWKLANNFEAGNFTAETMIDLTSYNNQVLFSKMTEYPLFADTAYREAGFRVNIDSGKLKVTLYGMGALLTQQSTRAVTVRDVSNLIPLHTWTQLAVEQRISGDPIAIFINGQQIASIYYNNNVGSSLFRFGADSLVAGSYHALHLDTLPKLTGSLKNLRIYNRLLSADELRQDAFNPCQLPTQNFGLLFWSPMNSAASNLVLDRIGQQYGVLSGFTWSPYTPLVPTHRLPSIYQYNSLNQVAQQYSPDGDTSVFFYDRLGRLTASQNKEQKDNASYSGTADRFSYTLYDSIGRITEVGEKSTSTDIRGINMLKQDSVTYWLGTGTNKQITRTIYDTPVNSDLQDFNTSRKRVMASIYLENSSDATGDSTLYNYDIIGNVKTLVQHIQSLVSVDANNGRKRMDYDYDLVSGKVNMVSYQAGKGDQFFYKYNYDADNRVTQSLTSRDKLVWIEDGSYNYYLHGPLARMELGQYKVQGVDYAYTLQGWLKGINSDSLSYLYDMAGDGWQGTTYSRVSRDVYAFKLGYFSADYAAIGKTTAPAFSSKTYTAPSSLDNSGNQLFNGNISNSTLALSKFNGGAATGYSYGYDQLNRLVEMRQHTTNAAGGWSNTNIITAYRESVAYDANGNILKYLRNGTTATPGMDSLTYKYNRDGNGNIVNNKLNYAKDSVPSGNYSVDIDNQSANNYRYDKIGNLVKDVAETLDTVEWNVYGKIKFISKAGGNTDITYSYDAGGNRTYKKVIVAGPSIDTTHNTWYIRDAQGNIMGVYTKRNTDSLKWTEQDLYGSARLGIWDRDTTVPIYKAVATSTDSLRDSLMLGSRSYELTNHLGNVLATISDKKIGNDSSGVVNYYIAEVLSQNDYYPFGMLQPARQFEVRSFRFGFNGQEKSDEIKGEDNSYTAEFWEYDPRLGRRWNIDPIQKEYESPFSCFDNQPITNPDALGNTTDDWIKKKDAKGNYHYTWDKNVTEKGKTPSGYEYVGNTGGYYINESQHINLWRDGSWSYESQSGGTSNPPDEPAYIRTTSSVPYTPKNESVGPTEPQIFNNDFERGMIKDNVLTHITASIVAPEFSLPIGAVETAIGVHEGDVGLTVLGGLDMLSGALSIKWGSALRNPIEKTGTVFDDITPTQPYYGGTQLPKSFKMNLTESSEIWVHGNATEHIAEYLNKTTLLYSPQARQLAMQMQLTSLQAATREATKSGIIYDQIIKAGGWELKFSQAAQAGQLPALTHARFLK